MTGTMFITGDTDADRLLNTDGTAVLIGMLLDQQVPMEWAFIGPATLLSAKRFAHGMFKPLYTVSNAQCGQVTRQCNFGES